MVMDKLRAKVREWAGVDDLKRRIASLEDDVDALIGHTGMPTNKIRFGRIAANAIKADKLKAGAITGDRRYFPVEGVVYKTRNGMEVGPMRRAGGNPPPGYNWAAPNFICFWDDHGRSDSGASYDLAEIVSAPKRAQDRAATEGWVDDWRPDPQGAGPNYTEDPRDKAQGGPIPNRVEIKFNDPKASRWAQDFAAGATTRQQVISDIICKLEEARLPWIAQAVADLDRAGKL